MKTSKTYKNLRKPAKTFENNRKLAKTYKNIRKPTMVGVHSSNFHFVWDHWIFLDSSHIVLCVFSARRRCDVVFSGVIDRSIDHLTPMDSSIGSCIDRSLDIWTRKKKKKQKQRSNDWSNDRRHRNEAFEIDSNCETSYYVERDRLRPDISITELITWL